MKNLIFLSLLTLTIFSCKKDKVEPDPVVEDPISGTTFMYSVGYSDTTSPYLDFDGGTLVLTQITWDGTLDGTINSTSISTSEITTYDVATGSATPEIQIVDIDPGNYSNISMGIELYDNGVDDNMILTGTYIHSNGNTIPIKFLFNSGEVFEGTINSYLIPEGKDTKATLILNPIGWFKNVSQGELDGATLDTGGTIVISESSNSSLYDKVETELGKNTLSGAIEFSSVSPI